KLLRALLGFSPGGIVRIHTDCLGDGQSSLPMTFYRTHCLRQSEIVELEPPHETVARTEDSTGRCRKHRRIRLHFLEHPGVLVHLLLIERHAMIARRADDRGE